MKIIRSTTGSKTCDWCRRLAGTYDYADVRKTGHDVWKRHAYCDCRIEYVSGTERYDVENFKKITKAENREKVAERKAVETSDDRAPEKIATRKALAGDGEEERARKHLLRDHPEIKVDWQTVHSPAYHEKFAQITDNETLNENLYKAAKEILNHRDGFMQEDLYLLDVETGKVVYKHTSATAKQSVSYTKKMRAVMRENAGRLVAIHNYPQGMPPSYPDINALHQKKQVLGIVVGHDGRVYKYQTNEGYSEIEKGSYDLMLAKVREEAQNYREEISDLEEQTKALEKLMMLYDFSFEEVRP